MDQQQLYDMNQAYLSDGESHLPDFEEDETIEELSDMQVGGESNGVKRMLSSRKGELGNINSKKTLLLGLNDCLYSKPGNSADGRAITSFFNKHPDFITGLKAIFPSYESRAFIEKSLKQLQTDGVANLIYELCNFTEVSFGEESDDMRSFLPGPIYALYKLYRVAIGLYKSAQVSPKSKLLVGELMKYDSELASNLSCVGCGHALLVNTIPPADLKAEQENAKKVFDASIITYRASGGKKPKPLKVRSQELQCCCKLNSCLSQKSNSSCLFCVEGEERILVNGVCQCVICKCSCYLRYSLNDEATVAMEIIAKKGGKEAANNYASRPNPSLANLIGGVQQNALLPFRDVASSENFVEVVEKMSEDGRTSAYNSMSTTMTRTPTDVNGTAQYDFRQMVGNPTTIVNHPSFYPFSTSININKNQRSYQNDLNEDRKRSM